MEYNALSFNPDIKEGAIVRYGDRNLKFNRYDLESAMYFDNWEEPFNMYFDQQEGTLLTDYICNIYAWPMVSRKLKKIIEEHCNGKLQFLSVNIKCIQDGKIEKAYILNIIEKIEALDLQKSVYFNIDGKYSIIKPALLKDKIGSIDIFRIEEDIFTVFISDHLKDIIEKENITGCWFREVKSS